MGKNIFIIFLAVVFSLSCQKWTSESQKTVIESSKAPKPIGPYSQAIRIGNSLFVSGQIAIDPNTGEMIDGDIGDEAKRVMMNIQAILTEGGFKIEDIVQTTIYLTDLNNFQKVNQIYSSYFKDSFPARTTVEVSGLPKNAHLEISVTASR